MATATIGVKLDEAIRARLRAAAERQGCTTHFITKQAILAGLERLERGDALFDAPASPEAGPESFGEGRRLPTPFLEFAQDVQPQSVLRAAITAAYRRPETECLPTLITRAGLPEAEAAEVRRVAGDLVRTLRAKGTHGLVETLLQEYALSTQEGIALMCLAEALLRIPDAPTRDALIRDKIGHGNWQSHLGGSQSLFVNAATWGLVVTGKLTATASESGLSAALTKLIARGGEPVIRRGVHIAMRLMGEQFVVGQTIGEALANSRRWEARGFRYSYDMLGEAALTQADSARYYRAYEQAIEAIGKAARRRGIYDGPGISIKLSALHPRYSRAQRDRVMDELLPRLVSLTKLARAHDIGINIDAEEADRLELSLDLLEALCFDPAFEGWNGIGFVVQAYQKRAPFVIDFLIDLASRTCRRIMVRLVKGAYWDSEIKRAQLDGLEGFPVFTRKIHTDVSYLACAHKLLAAPEAIYPQFATHNAHTVAGIRTMAGANFHPGQYEFQCLHGMGEPLYEEVIGPEKLDRPCRIYGPVGTHETLLCYLVRRLLENGANTSFVNRIANPKVPVDALIEDPVAAARAGSTPGAPHPNITMPRDIFFPARSNSCGIDLANEQRLASLSSALLKSLERNWRAAPMLAGGDIDGPSRSVFNPADRYDQVGSVIDADRSVIHAAFAGALDAAPIWQGIPPEDRAVILRRAADTFEARMQHLLGLIVREAGKTLPGAISEVREAVDFLRYYATQIASGFDNQTHRPLGPVVAISPWNFPLAIFMGQVAAALAAGNVVLAKPAEETPLIAAAALRILHQAGVPRGAAQLLPGDGTIGAALVRDPRARGVLFTGSTEVARAIQRSLADRLDEQGRPIPLIAETGGQNAMIIDSSALLEQAVGDILTSAFDSAGQRCSAARVVLVQSDIADRFLAMLKGAMAELTIGRPDRLAVDVGPVISESARQNINAHIAAMRERGFTITQTKLAADTTDGVFVSPTLIEIPDSSVLDREVFGPVLHVIRYHRDELDARIDAINRLGYGLTFGIHSRIDETIAHVTDRIHAGNIYVNRNMIGAVVGVQPFGGHGLSGTGPKAGGPLFLRRLLASRPELAPLPEGPRPARFKVFLAWLEEEGLEEACLAIGDLISSIGVSVELPGPVGEQNLYRFVPRGTVLCIAPTETESFRQIGTALMTGNRALVQSKADLSRLDRLPKSLRGWIARSEEERNPDIAACLFSGDADSLRTCLSALAERNGPVITVHIAPSQDGSGNAGYPLEFLAAEQSISINTTAAGGNASLMSIG